MYITDENADMAVSMINEEIRQILGKGELTKETLCLLGEMVDILKDMKEIDGADMSMDEGFSRTGRSYNSYNDGYSYARDRMGRYTSHGIQPMRYSGASDKEHLMNKYMDQASTESERELVRRIMNEI